MLHARGLGRLAGPFRRAATVQRIDGHGDGRRREALRLLREMLIRARCVALGL